MPVLVAQRHRPWPAEERKHARAARRLLVRGAAAGKGRASVQGRMQWFVASPCWTRAGGSRPFASPSAHFPVIFTSCPPCSLFDTVLRQQVVP